MVRTMPNFIGWMTIGESIATWLLIMSVLALVVVNLLYWGWAMKKWWKVLGTESHINWWNN